MSTPLEIVREGRRTAGESVEFGFDFFGQHVRVQKAGDRSSGRVAGDEEGTARSRWIFFEHGAETSSDWFHHFSGHRKEAGVAEVSWVILGLVSLIVRARWERQRTKKPVGDAGAELRLTAQSMKV